VLYLSPYKARSTFLETLIKNRVDRYVHTTFVRNSDPEFVKVAHGINFQPGWLVRQPYLTYLAAKIA
jgi:hypothetical protein